MLRKVEEKIRKRRGREIHWEPDEDRRKGSRGEPERWHVIWCYEVEGKARLRLLGIAAGKPVSQKEKKKRFCK